MKDTELLQGTLDMLILKVLAREDTHGWGIADQIKTVSKEILFVGEGSLYPALYRMENKRWIHSRWGTSENNRKAKYYSLTRLGQKQLRTESEAWTRLAAAVTAVMSLA
jgi:PadR family transcriptional regulator